MILFRNIEQALHLHPVLEAIGPGGGGGDAFGEADAVGAFAVDVHFGRHVGATQCQIELDAVFRGHGSILVCVEEEGRGCFGRYLFFARHTSDQGWIGVGAEQIVLRAAVGVGFAESNDRITED